MEEGRVRRYGRNESDRRRGRCDKKDLRRLFLRSWTIMCSWNYERQMHMGFMFGMAPILDKLYKNKPEKCREAYQRHMEFLTVHRR